MGFQFRLQAVQKVQAFQRDEKKQTLAELIQQQNELAEQLERLEEKKSQSRNERAKWLAAGQLQMERLQQYHLFESHLQQQIETLRQAQAQLQRQIETQRNSVLESEREVKKFEKLEEKQREAYRKLHPEKD